jgi:hypothetical protein
MLSDPVHLEGVPGGADLAAYLAHEATCRHVLRLHVSCHATRSNSVSIVLDVYALKVHKIENFLTPILEFALFLC